MRDLIVYGAGGFGRETALLIEDINQQKNTWNLVGFLDDKLKKGTIVDDIEILGGLDYLLGSQHSIDVVIAIADPIIRRKVVHALDKTRLSFPVMLHPGALTGKKKINSIGHGSIITAGCILTTGITIGEFSIVNLASTIGHDVTLNAFCSVMPGCNISGNVSIGEATMIGTGSQILQNLTIGKGCRVGAGAVVVKNVPDNLTVIGVPAKAI